MPVKPDVIYVSSDDEVPAPSPEMEMDLGAVKVEPPAPALTPREEMNLEIAKAKSPPPARAKKSNKYDLVADGTRWLREVAEALKKYVIVEKFGDSRDVSIFNSKKDSRRLLLVKIGRTLEVETKQEAKRSRVLVLTVLNHTAGDELSVLDHPGVVAANVMAKMWPKEVQEGQEVIVPLIEVEREVGDKGKVNIWTIRVYYNMTPTTPMDEPIKIPNEVIEKATKAVFYQMLSLL